MNFRVVDDEVAGWIRVRADNHLRPDARATIGKLVAVDTRDNNVLESHERQALGYPPRLVLVEHRGLAGLDVAEPARSGAGIAQDHDP